MPQDHFSANFDAEPDERTIEAHDHHEQPEDSYQEDRPAKKKRKVSMPVLAVGFVVLFIVCGMGYKKLTKPSHAQTSQVSELPPDNSGGMMQSNSPQTSSASVAQFSPEPLPPADANATAAGVAATPPSAAPASTTQFAATPAAPTPTPVPVPSAATPQQIAPQASAIADAGRTPVVQAAIPASASGELLAAATPAAAVASTTPQSAAVTADVVAQNDVIESLRKRIAALEKQAHPIRVAAHVAPRKAEAQDDQGSDSVTDAPATSKAKSVRHTGKHNRVETQLGYHIKQVIPGQGWVEDEATGKQIVITVGEKLGGAEVTKIDADSSKIYTTAGIIQ
jgi:hypothetical protein